MFAYAGIGSRKTPANILSLMTKAARRLDELGFVLRSGGALGADTAFELGAVTHKEIYLPWRNFNKNPSPFYRPDALAFEYARRHHPAWNRCSPAARKFHARNVHQVLGRDLASPANFVLCWTPGGRVTGGTGQAMRIAEYFDVPVINMFNDDWAGRVLSQIQRLDIHREEAHADSPL